MCLQRAPTPACAGRALAAHGLKIKPCGTEQLLAKLWGWCVREKLCEHRGFTCSQRGAVVVPSGRLVAELQSLSAPLQRWVVLLDSFGRSLVSRLLWCFYVF